MELRLITAKGKNLWTRTQCQPEVVDGKTVRLQGALQDITERKQAETYREMERDILEILNEPDELQGVIQRVLAALKTLTGVDAAGLRLQEGEDFPYFAQDGFSPDFLRTENSLVERGKDGGVCRDKDGNVCLECTCGLVISGKTDPADPFSTKGGSYWTNDSFPLLDLPSDQDPRRHPRNNCIHQGYASVALIPVRTKKRIVGLIQLYDRRKDRFTLETIQILESIAAHIGSAMMRKQAESELRRLSTAIEQSPETVMITDTEGTLQYVNSAFETITGYTREEAVGQNPRILKSGQQDAEFYTAMWNTLLDRRVWKGLMINTCKDGSLYTEEASIAPVKDSNGTITNYVAVKRDITVELEREEMFRQSQKMESVGQIAGGIAHDFNNMLQAILGFAEILLYRLAEGTPEYGTAQEIVKAAKRTGELPRKLLAFSRKQPVDKKEIHLNETVRESEVLLRTLLGEKNRLDLQLADDLRAIYADPGQMTQIIMNLAVNARDAMPDGGRLTITTENVILGNEDVAALPDVSAGVFACLSVTDTGCGMPQEVQDHLFEPFFTTKEVGKGTGLGMAVIYGIVKQNKGWIHVYSEEGQGTSIKVYLPMPADKNPVPSGGIPGTRKGERILLVEDDSVTRRMVVRILKTVDYQVTAVASAEAALACYSESSGGFDLLFSDIVLPGKTGLELADELKARHPDLPIILYSGYCDQHRRWESLDRKGYRFVLKPFVISTLLTAVRETLEN